MTAITQLPNHFYGQLETKTVPSPKLATGVTDTGLIFTLTEAIQYPDGTIPTLPFTFVVRSVTTGFPETCYAPANALSADGKTITLTNINQRGINQSVDSSGNIDFASGDSSRRDSHGQGSEVRISIHALDFAAMSQVQRGLLASGGTSWKVGDETDSDIYWYAANGDANEPYFKYVAASNKFVVASNGVDEIDMASGGITSAGDGLDLTAAVISVDTTDTNIFKTTTAGAGDVGKVAIFNASGLINQANVETLKDITATSTEINQALDGISANVTDTNLNTLTGGGNADALHVHSSGISTLLDTDTAGVSFANSNAENTLYSFSVPANSLSTANALRVRVYMKAMNSDGGSVDHTIKLKYGSTTLATSTQTGNSGAAGTLWNGCIEGIVMANGSTSAQSGKLICDLKTVDFSTTVNHFSINSVGTATEDSTGALTIAVTMQIANSNADYETIGATLELLRV